MRWLYLASIPVFLAVLYISVDTLIASREEKRKERAWRKKPPCYRERLERILHNIETPNFKYQVESDTSFSIGIHVPVEQLNGEVYQTAYPDGTDIAVGCGVGERCTDAEIINQVLTSLVNVTCHEIQEDFQYCGHRVADPHKIGDKILFADPITFVTDEQLAGQIGN